MKKAVLLTAVILLCGVTTFSTSLAFAVEIPPNATKEDCISYDPNRLEIVSFGDLGWRLMENRSHAMMLLDNPDDAAAALQIAKQHSQMCFIGRGNKRKNRRDYIHIYWK